MKQQSGNTQQSQGSAYNSQDPVPLLQSRESPLKALAYSDLIPVGTVRFCRLDLRL